MKNGPINMLALKLVRLGKPPTKALPATNYRDPAETVKFEREREMELKRKLNQQAKRRRKEAK